MLAIEKSKLMMVMTPITIDRGDGALISGDGGVRAIGDVGSLLMDASNACNIALESWGRPNAHASYNNQEDEMVSVNNVVIHFHNYIENSNSHPFPLLLEAIVVFV